MANEQLRKRPIKLSSDGDVKSQSLEKIFDHYDDRIKELDQRRITQQTAVETGATDADTIVNLVSAINTLFASLNASSLTED